jgi:hypothetical protein
MHVKMECKTEIGGMALMFENLAVYQKAVDFTEQVVTLTESFSRGYYFLTDQLNRASLSIATNLAEGNGRFTKADRDGISSSSPVAQHKNASHCSNSPFQAPRKTSGKPPFIVDCLLAH